MWETQGSTYHLGMVGIPWNTHKDGDDLGMVYGIGFPTLRFLSLDQGYRASSRWQVVAP